MADEKGDDINASQKLMNGDPALPVKVADSDLICGHKWLYRHRDILAHVGFFVILLLLVCLTAVCIGQEPDSYYSSKGKFCVACKDLRAHVDDDIDQFRVFGDTNTCCVNNETTLSTFVKYYTNHWYKVRLTDENPNYKQCKSVRHTSPFIRLTGAFVSSDTTSARVVRWNHSESSPDSSKLQLHRDGDIYIGETGLYFVYSQLVFKDTDQGGVPYNMRIFTHSVIKMQPRGSTTVLSGSNTPEKCGDDDVTDQRSSYLGSSVILHEGDRIMVKLAGALDVVPESEMNFFGITKT